MARYFRKFNTHFCSGFNGGPDVNAFSGAMLGYSTLNHISKIEDASDFGTVGFSACGATVGYMVGMLCSELMGFPILPIMFGIAGLYTFKNKNKI